MENSFCKVRKWHIDSAMLKQSTHFSLWSFSLLFIFISLFPSLLFPFKITIAKREFLWGNWILYNIIQILLSIAFSPINFPAHIFCLSYIIENVEFTYCVYLNTEQFSHFEIQQKVWFSICWIPVKTIQNIKFEIRIETVKFIPFTRHFFNKFCFVKFNINTMNSKMFTLTITVTVLFLNKL